MWKSCLSVNSSVTLIQLHDVDHQTLLLRGIVLHCLGSCSTRTAAFAKGTDAATHLARSWQGVVCSWLLPFILVAFCQMKVMVESWGRIPLLPPAVGVISTEVTYILGGLVFAWIVEEWVWDYAITVTLLHIAMTVAGKHTDTQSGSIERNSS